MREQVVSGLIELKKISREQNAADVLTKLLFGKDLTTNPWYILGKMGIEVKDVAELTSWMEGHIEEQLHKP